MLLFISGMVVGILSATTSWKNEVDKLNQLLRQMQNKVEDLQEELEMKEMLIVKAISDEGPVSNSIEKPDTLSMIEAELEAELEMLEQNLKAVDAISSITQFDEAEIGRGESRYDPCKSGNEITNYTVPPWELSLRLQEVIESRLKMQIKELELALVNKQNKVGSETLFCSPTPRTRSWSDVSEPDVSVDIPRADDCDESEMLLIKRIVERTRSGSHFRFEIN